MGSTSEVSRPLVSVIVPVFNERATVSAIIGALLRKTLLDVDLEIIVVESNSTDGTREEILKFNGHPRLKLFFEESPKGKGHAVRAGLGHARGEIILVQDADLEYDLDDYSTVLDPILSGRASFVLGTRHSGGMQFREFENAKPLSLLYNTGHWVLTGLINLLFRVNLTDPFTMYKVFRRDCLAGITLECDRFDFDCELLCKLLRSGYHPLEVPIRYKSRSFAQGKKVRTLRDPPTWIKAIVKCRFFPVRTSVPQPSPIALPRVASFRLDDEE